VVIDFKFQNQLNDRYTFDTFIVGAGNRVAYAVAQAVVQGLGKANTPLVLCGGVGTGKTHLLHAISHELGRRKPDASVYCSTESLTNVMISSLKHDKMAGLLDSLRDIDVLLVDDIQFLAGKERTMEVFSEIFGQLHSKGKQLVLAGCRSPKELAEIVYSVNIPIELADVIEIFPPDYETMIAILRRKAERERIMLSEECSQSIATSVGNVRELEGALTCLAAYASLPGAHSPMR